jgi:hypothetical protein
VIDLLARVLNAQIVITLLAMVLPSAMRWVDLIPAEVWERVFTAAAVTFVGGGLLKDAIAAFAKKDVA